MSRRTKQKGGDNSLEVKNSIKTLSANLHFMSIDNPIKTLVITSSVPNEGKTSVSIELARSIALSGKTVLLIEGDMRRRSLASRMNIHPQKGIYSVLAGEEPVVRVITRTDTENLFFLDAEPGIPNPADILTSRSYGKLLEALKSKFDLVMIDTPPVGTFVDAAIVSQLADGVIIVMGNGIVKRTDLVGAVEQLRKADARILGICATFCENTTSEYYYSYYTEKDDEEDSADFDFNELFGIGQEEDKPASSPASSQRKAIPEEDSTVKKAPVHAMHARSTGFLDNKAVPPEV